MRNRSFINPTGLYVDRYKLHVDRHRGKTRRVPIFRAEIRDRAVGASKYDPATEDRKHANARARAMKAAA